MSDAPCLLCAGPSPLRFRKGAHAIHRCDACDLEFVHPVPSARELAAVYERGYFKGDGRGFGYGDYFGKEKQIAEEKARERLDRLQGLGARPGGRLLDLGCADGTFLLRARERGFDVTGVEVSAEARAALPVALHGAVVGSVAEAAARGPIDVATLWDVLEHLPDPLGTLAALRASLAPGAIYGVVVPVIDNANARLLPRSWDQYKPPEHLWYFSRRSIAATLARSLGPVLEEEAAWRRSSRLLEVGLGLSGKARLLGAGERLATSALTRVGLLPSALTVDSWAVYGRCG